MKVFIVLGFLVSVVFSQDILEVSCGQDAIVAKLQKKVAVSAGFTIDDLHFNEADCFFDEDDGDYYIKRIEPFGSCGTKIETNDTHAVFSNSISVGDVETGQNYPHGIIVGQPENNQIISVSLKCTYEIDLSVTAAFLPNITYVYITIPDAVGTGEFKIQMAIYRTAAYRDPYLDPPTLEPEETVFVGVYMVEDTASDAFLFLRRCWATASDDPESTPNYELIADGCALSGQVKGSVRVTQNGIGHQALFQSKVFRFVGEGEDFKTVWLHCAVTVCIKKECEPTCGAARRKRRDVDGRIPTRTVSFGPIRKLDITLYEGENGYVETFVNNITLDKMYDRRLENPPAPVKNGINSTILIAVGALAAFCLMCLVTALVVVMMRLKRATSNAEGSITTTGSVNKSFSI